MSNEGDMMIIAIDVGNTNVVVGISHQGEWVNQWRWPTQSNEAYAFYAQKFSEAIIEERVDLGQLVDVVISSVVPDLNLAFDQIIREVFGRKALWLGPKIFGQLEIQTDKPDEIGSDLVANALAAFNRLKKACIVVDFGTALTFTIISDQGQILGVNIAPGLKTSINALFQNTAQLPEVPLRMPSSVIGKNTIHAIQSGILHGYVGLVRHQIKAIQEELEMEFTAVATGGLSSILEPLRNDFDIIDKTLTLDGLRLVALRYGSNKSK